MRTVRAEASGVEYVVEWGGVESGDVLYTSFASWMWIHRNLQGGGGEWERKNGEKINNPTASSFLLAPPNAHPPSVSTSPRPSGVRTVCM